MDRKILATAYTHAPRAPCRGGAWTFALLTRPGRPRPIRVRASDQLACVARPPARPPVVEFGWGGLDEEEEGRLSPCLESWKQVAGWVGRLVDRRRRARSVYRKGKYIQERGWPSRGHIARRHKQLRLTGRERWAVAPGSSVVVVRWPIRPPARIFSGLDSRARRNCICVVSTGLGEIHLCCCGP